MHATALFVWLTSMLVDWNNLIKCIFTTVLYAGSSAAHWFVLVNTKWLWPFFHVMRALSYVKMLFKSFMFNFMTLWHTYHKDTRLKKLFIDFNLHELPANIYFAILFLALMWFTLSHSKYYYLHVLQLSNKNVCHFENVMNFFVECQQFHIYNLKKNLNYMQNERNFEISHKCIFDECRLAEKSCVAYFSNCIISLQVEVFFESVLLVCRFAFGEGM